ncbi:laccase domain-containing protein [Candidatus Nomurabacteria bacterium]|nr:laccase domain-containing protein [Candidatus Nomurabacteria bacterium]
MRSSVPDVSKKYLELYQAAKIPLSTPIAYMLTKHIDGVQFLTRENVFILKRFQSITFIPEEKGLIGFYVDTDAIITKQKISLGVAVGDCSVIVATAVDRKDSKRFVIFVHSGFSGAILNVVGKAIDAAHTQYQFDNSDLVCAIYPSISGKNYKRGLSYLEEIQKAGLDFRSEFLIPVSETEAGFDFQAKIVSDLKDKGVEVINVSGLDTYEENRNRNLYSLTYAKENNLSLDNRFLVCVSLG